MSRDDYAQQGKQFVSDLRDTVGKKVADNEDTLRGTLGKAARWIDEKTGGKYADTIAKAETTVGEGIGKVAAQGGGPTATGEPQAPGAHSGPVTDTGPATDSATGPVTPPVTDLSTPSEGVPAPGATGPVTPPPPPEQTTTPITPPGQSTTPVTPPRDDSADWPRPPR